MREESKRERTKAIEMERQNEEEHEQQLSDLYEKLRIEREKNEESEEYLTHLREQLNVYLLAKQMRYGFLGGRR